MPAMSQSGGSNNTAINNNNNITKQAKLVRSQSIGVGAAVSGGINNINMGSADNKPVMPRAPHPDGRPAVVVLLDERRLELTLQGRLYAGELLDLVAQQCGLKEKEYFGLAVVDEAGHYTWLQLDRKVLEHDLPRKPAILTVHFLVKFFIESISHLADNQTVELFYLQARSLIWRGLLEVESDIVFQLAALGLQAAHGDYQDDNNTRVLLKKNTLLPTYVLKEQPSNAYCEDQVIQHYKCTKGQTRGQALVNYMTIVESMPTYGVHYFEVYDKRSSPWWLGLSCKGIAQYKHNDRKVPVRVFQWKQLENLYFRDKKFSIEVHDAKRVVQTLSSVNLYEDALKLDGSAQSKDELVDAIADSTTQVSVSRRSFNPGNIQVYVWYAQTSGLTKCIWQSAISQHQFYLDRKQARLRGQAVHRTLKEIARDLTRSSVSLSSASSMSNLSLTGSSHSLGVSGSLNSHDQENELTEDAKRARAEMVTALKARREALEEKLREKRAVLKELCIKEGELTGELPPEIPLAPGEPLPIIRKRVGTEFQISEKLLNKTGSAEEEQLAQLELELEIQSKITSAALKLANDSSARKNVRRQRKISYNQCQKKLKELEFRVASIRHNYKQKKIKQPRQQQHHHTSFDASRSQQQQSSLEDQLRRGKSVPDLGQESEGESGDEDEDVDTVLVSPRSCPSSPRKQPIGLPQQNSSATLNHQHIVHNRSQKIGGYIPSSVYLRSSYRTKQYPTLSTKQPAGPMKAPHWIPPDHDPRSQTLPGPYKNRFEANSGCDSPLGLYNCPQQRTSQAFSSLDDLDGLAGMGPPPARKSTEATTHYPSLERSAKKKQKQIGNNIGHGILGVHQQEIKPESRSLENLEVLENAGARGSVRPRNRNSQLPNPETLAAREKALDDLVYRTNQTTLKNNEEYPPPTSSAGGFDDVDGSYPALPLAARRTTLLPGQTYPEPVSAAHNLLTHTSHHHSVTTLRDALSPPRVVTNYSHTFTVHARKVETTFGLNDSVRTNSVINNDNSESPKLPQRHGQAEEVKPPLFPKQYYNSVKQRQSHASPITDNHLESPAVPRKLKPSLSTTSAQFNHSVMQSSATLGGSDTNNSSFDTSIVENNVSHGGNGAHTSYMPYRETSKPFEMADFYKYSTKFRKASASSLRSADSDSPKLGGSESPRSGSGSQRSSTSRESVPPELPTKPSNLSAGVGGGSGMLHQSGTVSAVPAMARLPPPSRTGDEESLADAFSNEMLAWYEQKQTTKPNSNSGKPATLV